MGFPKQHLKTVLEAWPGAFTHRPPALSPLPAARGLEGANEN